MKALVRSVLVLLKKQPTVCTVGVTLTVFGLRRKHEQALKTPDTMLAFVALSANILGIGFSVIGVGIATSVK